MEFLFSDRVKNLSGNAIREIFKILQDPEMISFAGGLPMSAMLPKDLISKYTSEILSSDEAVKVLQYGLTDGYPPLRKNLLKYVEKAGIYGMKIENTLVISGGQQAIDLAFKCLTNEGDTVLVQNPTYLAALHIAKTYRLNAVGVNNNTDGIDLVDLEQKIIKHNPKLLYVVPTFHNPTGLTMSEKNRKALAELSSKYNLVVVEDDPYRDLRYEKEPVDSIKSYDKVGNILYVTSFSKVVSPGLRIGALIGDERLLQKFSVAKQAVDVHTNGLSQAIINRFLENGDIEKLNEVAKPIYKEKLDFMLKMLDSHMGKEIKFTRPEGGLFIWCEISEKSGLKAKDIFPKAIENKVAFVCGPDFFAEPADGERFFRLNFSNATLEQIEKGVKKLAEVFN